MKRLGQVVVRAGIETGDAIVDGVPSGEHEHRNRIAVRPQLAAHIEAALHRQHKVEDHDIVRHRRCLLDRGGSVTNHIDGVPVLPQALRGHARGGAFVFNQQDSQG